MLERKIIIGMITSTLYLQQIRPACNTAFFKSAPAKRIAKWCLDYFDEYKEAPGRNIETIYLEKVKKDKIPPDIAEEIEDDILPGLSDEYEEGLNLEYLKKQTEEYFAERDLYMHQEHVKFLLDGGAIEEAQRLTETYKPLVRNTGKDLNLHEEAIMDRIAKAFAATSEAVVTFPGALGEMWNSQFTRGSLIGIMAAEKRGKSYMLLEIAIRASRNKAKVAFFQAGDMTEDQQLRRICINRARKSDKEKYCGKMYLPVKDCMLNQLDECDKHERECDFGLYGGRETPTMKENYRKELEHETLVEALKDYPDYKPCYNCKDWAKKPWGVPWLKEHEIKTPLDVEEAQKAMAAFFIEKKRQFKLSTHANGTLTVGMIETLLDTWDRQEGFVPDIIIIDYADLLVSNKNEFRHQQDDIWKGLRRLSQERHSCVVTVTQADASSYDQDKLKLKNFSEDKRKYAHVTAMYALNQDKMGREKKLGIVRIGELVVREDDFDVSREVYLLQSLRTGQPFLASFW